MNDPVLIFAFGVFAVVVLAGAIIGISSLRWSWNNTNSVTNFQAKQLHFGAVTLTGLGLLFALAMAMYYWGPAPANGVVTNGQKIFEACSTIIPPIVTLVLGYYFGKDKGEETTRR